MTQSFPSFRPHPLIRGGHLQTVIGSYLPWGKIAYSARQHRVPLADGDQIVVHDDLPATKTWQMGDPIVLLLHGLGGSHLSSYMQRCTVKLTARGYRVFRMDLRGYGAGFPLARHPVHAGRSEDAGAVLDHLLEMCPDSPLHLVGFSMGANIVLKLAGELGPLAPGNLASVMAVSPPIDLMECSRNIQLSANRLYDRMFVRSLLRHIQRRNVSVPGALARPLDPPPRRLFEFDTRFTAPLAGFADAEDYYTRASSGVLLRHIVVPTLILSAANDPIVPVKPFETASYSPTTKLLITPCGGHLGFVARRSSDPDRRWLDWRVVEWIESHRGFRPEQRTVETGHSAHGRAHELQRAAASQTMT